MPPAFTPSLIVSKLHPPRLPSRHVERQRLVARLSRNNDRFLTLICAPAGSGKTTLMREWSCSLGAPVAWVSLDEDDNDLGVFLGYVLAAVQSLFPALTLRTRALLRSPTLPPDETLAVSLSNDLDQVESDFILALDDYHVITNPQIDAVLRILLRHPPRSLHLAVATRAEPAWPLRTLRARGRLTELRFDDLRFTAEESATFLRKALDDNLEDDYVTSLHDETEGWAAGLHLMTLLTSDDVQSRILDERGVGDVGSFLLEEVFARQPPETQERLLRMSILDRFCASLCETVCGDDVDGGEPDAWGRPFLVQIERLNLFLIALDGHNEFFRFHHLFRRFLSERLRERMDAAAIAELHRRASAV
jgi:LuxR family maltose regulon positive regulatory protein